MTKLIYRVMQEQRAVLGEVTVWVTVRKLIYRVMHEERSVLGR